MSSLARRPVILAITVVVSAGSLWRFGLLPTIIVMTIGVTTAILAGRYQARHFVSSGRRLQGRVWQPTVQHHELPPPVDDPAIGYGEPTVEFFATRTPPLADVPLDGWLRTQLDGLALGRAKRILEAPHLLPHAAADAESWPDVEAAVQKSLELARSRHVEFIGGAQPRLTRALALAAAQGVLLAEWRQLEDGKTIWEGANARIRASDAFTIQRIADAMERQLLPDLFAGVARRSPDFELRLLVPYTMATAFYLRLRGDPPRAFAALAA